MKKSIKFMAVLLFALTASFTAFSQRTLIPNPPPREPSSPSTPIDEYGIGYGEGLQYAKVTNYSAYLTRYDHYQEAMIMYPQNTEFYTARILGLVDGWYFNWVEYSGIDFSSYNRIWDTIKHVHGQTLR